MNFHFRALPIPPNGNASVCTNFLQSLHYQARLSEVRIQLGIVDK